MKNCLIADDSPYTHALKRAIDTTEGLKMKNCLIADDSSFMRAMMRSILTQLGHRVVGEAENGEVAVEKYKELSPDIVTMDITMDKKTGIEALGEILEYDKKAKVIMVSAMGQTHFVKDSMALGAKGFLVKPFETGKIKEAIDKLG